MTRTREQIIDELTSAGGPFQIVEQIVHGVPMRVYAVPPRTLRELLMATAQFGDNPFLAYQDERWTFAEHLRIVAGVARHFRDIASGGAPVPPDLITRIESDFNRRVSPANGYGLTETTSAVIANSGEMYFEHPDSVGKAAPGTDVRIVDLSGLGVRVGVVGELWVRGPNVVRGYWNRPTETSEAFTDGWFHTGDLGYIDADGYVYVVDRLKDVVIRGCENVYCAEVENVLFQHPGVFDAAVIGLPDPVLGEEVVAVIQPRPGIGADADDLRAFAASRLAEFEAPTRVVLRDEPLPRNAVGKVLKRELRGELADADRHPRSARGRDEGA